MALPISPAPRENSLTHLCAGVVTSAFEGVCSGVASATWAAVQGAANTLMNGCLATQAQMPASSNGPADVMQCLAGSGAKPEQHTHLARLCLHQAQTRTNQLQSNWCSICRSSNCSYKSNFWLCKKSSRQWKWQQQQQLRQALKTNLARRYLPSQPMKT